MPNNPICCKAPTDTQMKYYCTRKYFAKLQIIISLSAKVQNVGALVSKGACLEL